MIQFLYKKLLRYSAINLVALLLLPALSFAQQKGDTLSLLSGKVIMVAPPGLSKMSDEMYYAKYHKTERPTLVLSDKNGEVNFIADNIDQPVNESQLGAFRDFQIQGLKNRRPDINVLDQGLKTINGHKVAWFKFVSQAIDQKVFNHYFFAVVNGKILFCTFNCIQEEQAKWAPVADQIMNSLSIR
jgi:hypothetical protein